MSERRRIPRKQRLLLLLISSSVMFAVGRHLARRSHDHEPDQPSWTTLREPVDKGVDDEDSKKSDLDGYATSGVAAAAAEVESVVTPQAQEMPAGPIGPGGPNAGSRSASRSKSGTRPKSTSRSKTAPERQYKAASDARSEPAQQSEPSTPDAASESVSERDGLTDLAHPASESDIGSDPEVAPAPQEPVGIQPLAGGACPLTHPIKARFSTGRYHRPEDDGYDKVVADRCYATVDEAEAGGFTLSRW